MAGDNKPQVTNPENKEHKHHCTWASNAYHKVADSLHSFLHRNKKPEAAKQATAPEVQPGPRRP